MKPLRTLLIAIGAILVTGATALGLMLFYVIGTELYFEHSEGCLVRHDTLQEAQSNCLWGFTAEEITFEETPKGFVDDRFTYHLDRNGSTIIALHFLWEDHALHVIIDPDGKILWYIPSYM